MLINTHDLRARSTRQLADALADLALIPALDSGGADAVGELEFALADPAIVGLKDLQPVGFGAAQARAYAGKAVTEIAATGLAVVLGHREVQHQHLVALSGVLKGALTGGFDP